MSLLRRPEFIVYGMKRMIFRLELWMVKLIAHPFFAIDPVVAVVAVVAAGLMHKHG